MRPKIGKSKDLNCQKPNKITIEIVFRLSTVVQELVSELPVCVLVSTVGRTLGQSSEERANVRWPPQLAAAAHEEMS